MYPNKKKLRFIAIVGPTSSGKTSLGIHLANALNSEVLSADSQLVYQGLDIGTGKPTLAESRGIKHHMMDLVSPQVIYSASQYRTVGRKLLDTLHQEGKIPIVVGGTGLYVRALQDEPMSPDIPPNPAFRAKMLKIAEAEGAHTLHKVLTQLDTRRAKALHPHDQFRIIRALEIIDATGKPVPEFESPDTSKVLWIGLTYDNRDRMRQAIDLRIQDMLGQGWVNEVKGLLAQYGPDTHALSVALGYPQLAAYVKGLSSLDEAITDIETNTHQYASRQLTWYRQPMFSAGKTENDKDVIHWISVDAFSQEAVFAKALTIVQEALN